jgi:predicted Zn-dependent peptidase
MNRYLLEKPAVRPVIPGKIPEARFVKIRNSIPVYLIEAGMEEIERIEFTFGAGCAQEYLPMLASTVNNMLTEGTVNYTAAKLNRELDFHGAFYHQYSEKDRAGIVIYCMNKHLEKILELAREILFSPVFPLKELRTMMKKRFRSFLVNREKVKKLATDQFFESIFGQHHPYGRQIVPDDFKSLDPLVLKDFHSGYYTPENMAIIVSGKIHENIADLLNYYFGDIKSDKPYIEESCSYLEKQKKRLIHIEKSGAVQTAIKIGSASINKRHDDYPGLKILNVILGGYFGSRLMRNIREDKGYTYGIGSSVSSLNLSGFKVISTEVSNNFTQKAIDEIYNEIRLLQRIPVEKGELTIVKNYMLGDMVRMFDGPFALAESFRSVWEFGLDNSYYYRLAEKIRTIEPDEITALAQTYYNIDDLYEITAG